MEVVVPDPCLIVLVGPSSSGKSTFASARFAPSEVLCSEDYRLRVSGDPNDMGANEEAFALLHGDVAARLLSGLLTVVDATNVQIGARTPLLTAARAAGLPAVAVVFDLPLAVLRARHAERADRPFEPDVLRRQRADLRRSLPELEHEGYAARLVIQTPEEADAVRIRRERSPSP
jgi:protein phosphatase